MRCDAGGGARSTQDCTTGIRPIGIVFFASGRLSQGALTIDGDRWDYEWTTHTAKGASRLRETLRFRDNDTQVWSVEAERDGKWLPISGEMTNTRVRDK